MNICISFGHRGAGSAKDKAVLPTLFATEIVGVSGELRVREIPAIIARLSAAKVGSIEATLISGRRALFWSADAERANATAAALGARSAST